MAARGTIAKEEVVKILKQAFGNRFIGEYDKKYYVSANDGGEEVQIAIALTCPKVPVGQINMSAVTNELNFEEMSNIAVAPTIFEPAEVTEEELATVQELMRKLGL